MGKKWLNAFDESQLRRLAAATVKELRVRLEPLPVGPTSHDVPQPNLSAKLSTFQRDYISRVCISGSGASSSGTGASSSGASSSGSGVSWPPSFGLIGYNTPLNLKQSVVPWQGRREPSIFDPIQRSLDLSKEQLREQVIALQRQLALKQAQLNAKQAALDVATSECCMLRVELQKLRDVRSARNKRSALRKMAIALQTDWGTLSELITSLNQLREDQKALKQKRIDIQMAHEELTEKEQAWRFRQESTAEQDALRRTLLESLQLLERLDLERRGTWSL